MSFKKVDSLTGSLPIRDFCRAVGPDTVFVKPNAGLTLPAMSPMIVEQDLPVRLGVLQTTTVLEIVE
jgi:hypothetical protein